MLRFRSIEVHHVQSLEAEALKLLCLAYRVFVVYFLTVVLALCEAYAFAIYQVYGWYQFYHRRFYILPKDTPWPLSPSTFQ